MSERHLKSILMFASAAFLVTFCTAPFAWMLVVSVSEAPDFLSARTVFDFTFQNYVDILSAGSLHLLAFLKNSIVVSSLSALLATIFASLSAYGLTRFRFPGRILIPVVLLGFSMFPQITIVGYLFKLMAKLGWINTYPALIFPYIALSLPLALWIMLSYFSQLPLDLDRAAMVDGATRFQILRKVLLPVALPGAFSTLLVVFIFSFNEFLFALMLTIDDRARTVPVGLALFEGLYGQIPWGHVMAAAVISTIPMILLSVFFQRHIVQGLTQGAVKE